MIGVGMLKGWFDRKMSRVQTEEAELFLNTLMGANEDVLAGVLSKAILSAAIFRERFGYNLYEVAYWIEEFPLAAHKIGAEIRQLQKEDRPEHCVGFMVWLHTVRAAAFPELMVFARKIWDELDRAPLSHAAFVVTGNVARVSQLELISAPGDRPIGFESLRK